MEHLTGPIIGLMFLQRNHTVLDMRQGILNFPFFADTDAEFRAKFLENFDWKDSTLTTEEKEKTEELLGNSTTSLHDTDLI